MRRISIILLILLATIFICIYFFIPAKIEISSVVSFRCTTSGASRYIHNENNWFKWWPGDKGIINNTPFYTYGGHTFHLSQKLYNATEIQVSTKSNRYNTKLSMIPLLSDSIALQWQCLIDAGANPIKKIYKYLEAKHIKNSTATLLDSLSKFLKEDKHIYGIEIKRTTLKDTTLVSIKTLTNSYPATSLIYDMIESLKEYIKSQKAEEANYPMLNITKTDSGYLTMVGVPTNRELKGNGKISPKRMIPFKNKILTTEVKGGQATIDNAYKQIENYMHDHDLSAPVIPFEYLVTDRTKEPDTTKWTTLIYYPIR